jgi:hypothetical protein
MKDEHRPPADGGSPVSACDVEIIGIFDDEGKRYEPGSIPLPPLCETCAKKDYEHPFEAVLCQLSRLDHMLGGRDGFACAAHETKEGLQ